PSLTFLPEQRRCGSDPSPSFALRFPSQLDAALRDIDEIVLAHEHEVLLPRGTGALADGPERDSPVSVRPVHGLQGLLHERVVHVERALRRGLEAPACAVAAEVELGVPDGTRTRDPVDPKLRLHVELELLADVLVQRSLTMSPALTWLFFQPGGRTYF